MDSGEEGQLQVIIGPIFSGKTSELIRRIQRYHLATYRCLIVRHTDGNDLELNTIVSHDGNSLPAIRSLNLSDLDDIVKSFDVIGIDEGHLFSDLVEFCQKKSDGGKVVIVAGLDCCEEQTYHEILNIIPFAETVTKLTAICMSCAGEATFTKSLPSDRGNFISVCGSCYAQPEQIWRSPFKTYVTGKRKK